MGNVAFEAPPPITSWAVVNFDRQTTREGCQQLGGVGPAPNVGLITQENNARCLVDIGGDV